MPKPGAVEIESELMPQDGGGFDLFDLLLILSRNRTRILLCTVLFAVLGILIAILLKPTYTATALIVPPEESHSASSLMGQLGPLAALAGGGALRTPADTYVGFLGSRTVADKVIEKFDLRSEYKVKKQEDARIVLKSKVRFLATKDGLIHISVEDHDPRRASDLTNAFVDQLYDLNSHLAITEASQRRVFFDQELAQEKSALAAAESSLRQSEEKSGVIQLSGQAESIIRSIAQIRAEIASREVQLQALKTYATDQNPEEIRAREEISAFRTQLAELEKNSGAAGSSAAGMAATNVPEVSLEYARRLRDVKYHETLYDLLSRQYEAARIDEAKAAPIIQIVDRAVPPDRKSGPHRTLITLGFAVLGFFFGCVGTLVLDAYRRIERVPEYAFKLTELKRGFSLRR